MRALALITIFLSTANAAETPKSKSIKEILHTAKAAKNEDERTQILSQLRSQPIKVSEDVDAIYSELKSLEVTYRTDGFNAKNSRQLNKALAKSTDKAIHQKITDLLEAENQELPNEYFGPIEAMSPTERDRASLRLMRLGALLDAAGSGKNELALPVLRKISDKGGIAAESAVLAIGKIGKSEDLDRLIDKIKSDPKARIDLTPFGGKIISRIMKEIDDPKLDDQQRNSLISRLGQARSSENIEKYRALLHHKNPRVVKVAAQAVSESAGRDSGALAIQMISDSDRQIRLNGLLALKQVDWSPSYTQVVLDVLAKDKDEGVREIAAHILGVKKAQGSEVGLRAALNDNSKRVRESAQSALDDISGKRQNEINRQVQEILKRNGKK